eukprot:4959333-Prymnesium_polylepis.1
MNSQIPPHVRVDRASDLAASARGLRDAHRRRRERHLRLAAWLARPRVGPARPLDRLGTRVQGDQDAAAAARGGPL